MSLISLVVFLVIIGLILWLVESLLPISPQIKKIIYVVLVLFVILFLLQAFGLLGSMRDIRID